VLAGSFDELAVLEAGPGADEGDYGEHRAVPSRPALERRSLA